MKRFLLIFLSYLSLIIHPASAMEPAKLTIAAASDLKSALDDLSARFKKQHPEAVLEIITGSSGKFYEQIVNDAPFDLFFSADINFPKQLEARGLTASAVRLYARGRIVLWSARMDASKMTLKNLSDAGIKKIAIANPKHAPYGMRAQEALQKAGLWEKVQKKLVFGENIAQTVQFVEIGAADVVIIALSLALSPNLKAKGGYYLIPENQHQPLDQAYVLMKRAEGHPLAQTFMDYLESEPAQAILRAYGFTRP